MIFSLARLFFLAFLGLSVIYLVLRWFTASLRREALEDEFKAKGLEGERNAFVESGMKKYRKSFRRKALVGVRYLQLRLLLENNSLSNKRNRYGNDLYTT